MVDRKKFLITFKAAAFTLAEVLITLAIIGVVAALTLPGLIQKYEEKATVTKVQKIYSVLTNAYNLAKLEYGEATEWGLSHKSEDAETLLDIFSKYINHNKVCHIGDKTGCFPDVLYKNFNGTHTMLFTAERTYMQISDGTLIMFNTTATEGELLAQFYVDINGFKGPNQRGYDFFYFYLWTDDAIRPGGWKRTIQEKDNDLRWNLQSGGQDAGVSFANWIIEKGNMEYLRCDDLSYSGKSKCSEK